MKSKRSLFLVISALLVMGLLFAAIPTSKVSAATITVCASGCDYTTIQAAIAAATTGDTINVADGTYTITAAITVNKEVTITGNTSNPENVVVKYNPASTSLNSFEIGAANITIQGFKIVDSFRGVHFGRSDVTSTGCAITNCVFDNNSENAIGEVAAENTTISNNTVTNCNMGIEIRANEATSLANRTEVTGNTISSCNQSCIQTYLGKYVYIYNNTINSTNDKGINIIRSNATGTADRIQVIGNIISETKWPGIQVIGAPYTYVYDNTLTKCNYYGADGTGDFDYASIHVQDDIGPTYSNHTIIDSNTVSDGINGIQLWSDSCTVTNNTIYDMGKTYADTKVTGDGTYHNSAILYGDMYDVNMPTSATISGNNIHDNYWGLFVTSAYTGTVTAEENWWGDASGPSGQGPGTGDAVSTNVDYSPWLGATPGTSPMTWYTNDSIQDAIDAATAGDTVNVADGTYGADPATGKGVYITKDGINLIGESRDATIIDGAIGGVGSSGSYWPKGIHIQANNVTVRNFTVQGFTGDGVSSGGYGVLFRDYAHDTPGEGFIFYTGSVVDNVKLQDNYSAMYALVHQNLTVENSLIQNNQSDGMFIARESDNATITNNTVLNSGDHGIWVGNCWAGLGPSDNATITGNTVNGAREGGISFVGSDGAIISGNTITNVAGEGWSVGALSLKDSPSNVDAYNNTIYNNDGSWNGYSGTGHGVGIDGTPSNINLHDNSIYSNNGYGCYNYSTVIVTAEENWWGSASGPGPVGPGGGDNVSTYVDYNPWCGDSACSFKVKENADGSIEILPGASAADIQTVIDSLSSGDTLILPAEVVAPVGGFTITTSGITIVLQDGTVVQGSSPCFVVSASNTKITTESIGGATCIPTSGSNGIDVAAGLTNIIIEGLEINGTGQTTGNGINFAGAITDVQIVDNYIHDLDGDGIYFAATPAGTVDIQGNLLLNNSGVGISSPADINVAYNAWGSYGGPSTGDGISGITSYTPWTHVDLYLASSGTVYSDQVVKGETITYTVYGNLQNVMGTEFTFNYPANLTYSSHTLGGQFPYSETLTIDGVNHTLTYKGSRQHTSVSGQNLELFTVTFTGSSTGKNLVLAFDETNDSFAMSPGYGPSLNIYASALTGIADLEVIDLPTLSSSDLVGPYVAGILKEFQVTLTNPSSGGTFTNVLDRFTIKNTVLADIYSFEYYYDGTWYDMPLSQDGSDVVGYFGPSTGFPLSAPYDATTTFRVVFKNAGNYEVEIKLDDLTPDPDWTLATLNATVIVNGDFNVTGTVSMQGRTHRGGVPMTLTKIGLPVYGPFNATSIDQISNNLTFTLVNGGSYTITTNQPRYLNVTEALSKTISVTAATFIEALELKGGNAVWTDNIINTGDASLVGTYYGQTIDTDADVNFSGTVDIFDLALVGGNFDLTSATAYASWVP